MRACSVEGCGKIHFCRGFCRVHHDRWRRHGSPHIVLKALAKRGEPMRWLKDHAGHEGDACLIWPFARLPDGRAHMRLNGRTVKPSRLMCEIVNGPPPTPAHEAAHSCGKAHDGCVHPGHLRWATTAENAEDKIEHGTVVKGERHPASKLTREDVASIRALRGKMELRDIGKMFGVNASCICKIHLGHRWKDIQP